jgi:hypothetical protein
MRLSLRLLRVSLAALLPAAGLILGLSSAAGAATHSTTIPHTLTAAQRTALIREITRELHQGHPTMISRGIPLNQVKSTNWSGYADTGATFTKLSGNWTEPTGHCSSTTTSLAAFWVGIDGYSSPSVEQDGTLIECASGTAHYFSWWEMYPSNAVQIVSSAVRPGDKITASVTRSSTRYTLKVTDSTHTAASFTRTESCSNCKNNSAEWIAEAPSGSAGIYPLTNFGTWSEYNASVSSTTKTGTISSFTNHEIIMVDSSGNVKAQPSGLSNGGRNFSVTWKRRT